MKRNATFWYEYNKEKKSKVCECKVIMRVATVGKKMTSGKIFFSDTDLLSFLCKYFSSYDGESLNEI